MKKIYKSLFSVGVAAMLVAGFFACSEEEPLNMAPSFKLNAATDIMRTSATFTGTVSGATESISAYGFEYSLSEDFTSNLTTRLKVGDKPESTQWTTTAKGLEANERYYYRMYATTGVSTVYSQSQYFQTSASSAPSMSALKVDSVGENLIRLKCTIEEIGDEYLIEYGVGYKKATDKSYNPIPSDSIVPESIAGASNTFFVEITGLEPATKYSFRPYAKNSADANGDTGTREGYGTILEQQTENQLSAVVTTAEILDGSIGMNSISVSGMVTSAVGSDGVVDVCGFCWSESNATPSIVDEYMEVEFGKLNEYFKGTITNLQPGMTYYVRAYAKNTVNGSERIGYGEVYEVTTANIVTPKLEWVQQENEWGNMEDYYAVTPSSIRVKANIKNYDKEALIEKGLIWSKTNGQLSIQQARIDGTYLKLDLETGGNIIDGTITGLEMNTNYYVRAYAIYQAADIEEVGYTSGYRSIKTQGFETPYLDNVEVPDEKITRNSAELIGKISSTGNGEIKERGFCVSLVTNTYEPTIENCDIRLEADDTFIVTAKDLTPSKEYAVRAYLITTLESKTDTTYNGWRTCFWTKDVVYPTFNNLAIDDETKTYNSISLSTKLATTGDGKLIEKGFIWSAEIWDVTLENADGFVKVEGDEFAATISNLKASTHYKFRAYAKNKVDGIDYITYSDWTGANTNSIRNFSLNGVEIPNEELTRNSVKLIGKVSSEGTGEITERGFCLSLTEKTYQPTITNCDIRVKSDDSFISIVNDLKYQTEYSVQSYVISKLEANVDTVYSGWNSFWTKGLVFPTFNRVTVDENLKTHNTIHASSKIVTVGDGKLLEKGFVWNLDGAPTLENAVGSVKVSTDSLAATVTKLVPNTYYYIRAYAKVNIDNQDYVRYSDTKGVSTKDVVKPQLSWEKTTRGLTSFTIEMKIDSLGQGEIVEQGFLWSQSTEDNAWPETTMESHTGKLVMEKINKEGFIGTITGLYPSTDYVLRPYMKIKVDDYEYVYYHNRNRWNTSDFNIDLSIKECLDTSCEVVGYATDDELPEGITEYGFCWSAEDVQVSEMKNQMKASTPNEAGEFSATIDSLKEGTGYYIGMYVVYKERKFFANGRWHFTTKRTPSIDENVSPDKKD